MGELLLAAFICIVGISLCLFIVGYHILVADLPTTKIERKNK